MDGCFDKMVKTKEKCFFQSGSGGVVNNIHLLLIWFGALSVSLFAVWC